MSSSQPERFVHGASHQLRPALCPDPRYSECRHLPLALERCLRRSLALHRLGASPFALHCRAAYGNRAPAPLVPPSDPPPWLFGGGNAAALGVPWGPPPGRHVGAAGWHPQSPRAGSVLLVAEDTGLVDAPSLAKSPERWYGSAVSEEVVLSAPPRRCPWSRTRASPTIHGLARAQTDPRVLRIAAHHKQWTNDREYIESRLTPANAQRLNSNGGVCLCYGCFHRGRPARSRPHESSGRTTQLKKLSINLNV